MIKRRLATDMKLEHIFCIVTYLCVEYIAYATGSVCGKVATTEEERIIGGYAAKRKSWPWVVSISFGSPLEKPKGVRDGHICGGTLIHRQWVLTAAHCLDVPGRPNVFPKRVPKQWRVIAGMYNRTAEEQQEGHWQISFVRRFAYHNDFQDFNTYSVNDVAMVQLAQPFTITDYVRPICLPRRRQKLLEGWNKCFIAGWGTMEENSTTYSLTLQEIPMFIISQTFCEKAYTTVASYRVKQHICGGDTVNGNKDACKGDSGGPLACEGKNGDWHVAGIISWGIGCGRANTPGVYTKVNTYLEWIRRMANSYTVQMRKKITPKKSGRRRRSIIDAKDFSLQSTRHMLAEERYGLWRMLQRKRRSTSKSSFLKFIRH